MSDTAARDGSSSQYCYRPEQHFTDTFRKLSVLRKSQKMCDICIKVANHNFYAHKAVLVASSPYFEAMFLSGMSECCQNEVELVEADPGAFSSILNFFYEGEVCINSDNVQSILSSASVFQIEGLKIACAEYLQEQLSPNNCLGINSFAEGHGCVRLQRVAKRFALSRYVDVSKGEEFLMLPVKQVADFLSNDNLRVASEEEVYDSAIRWVNFNVQSRAAHLPFLLGKIRFPLMSPIVLVDKVRSNQLVNTSLECRDLVDEALLLHHLLPERSYRIPVEKTRPRRCYYDTGIIYTVGGLNSLGGTLSSVESFDSFTERWDSAKPMNTFRNRVGVAIVKNKLYAFGGYDGSCRLSTVECYDSELNEWGLKSPMSTKRSALSIAVIDHYIYVIGGYDGNNSLSTMERYDVNTDLWVTSPSMHTCRSAAGACVLGKYVYVAGGHDGLSIFNTVERYDPDSGAWTMVTPMNTRRCRVGVTSTDKYLFSVGGYDGQAFLNSAEYYNPISNVWTNLPSMTCSRSRVGVVAIAKKIYAIGGYDGLSNLCSVEIYDLEQGQWLPAPSMNTHQGGVGVAVILRE